MVTKEYENCENENKEIHQRQNEAFYQKGLHITLQKRRDKQILIISPKYQHQIYVAVKAE